MKLSFYKIIFLLIQIIILISGCKYGNSQINKPNKIEIDSINHWIDLSKNRFFTLEIRKKYLLKAYLSNSILEDSIKNKNLLSIAYQAKNINDTVLFLKVNLEAYKLSVKIKDTFGIADTHWNLAALLVKKEKLDSAYYHYHKAFLSFNSINHDYYTGKMLYNMAFIQSRYKNYIESEILTFRAISKFEPLKKYRNIYQSYNRLGIIFADLEEYNKSLFYHNKALEYLDEIENKKTFKEGSLNNIGLVYQKKENFKSAIDYFEKALSREGLKSTNINLYARLIDNLAYSRFLNGDSINVLNDFNIALDIRDSLNNKSGIAISKIHLAKYFTKFNDTLRAIVYAKDALQLSSSVKNNRDILASLKFLSVIDKQSADDYLNNYIYLADSLQKEERKIRDKFTRIQFETDEYIQETKELSNQRKWIIITSSLFLAFISLLYYFLNQKARNKSLILENEQQKANEEIYELLLLQQTKKNEGKLQERNRISEDLHDGVLGKLFGTRLGLGFLDVKGDNDTKEKYKSLLNEIQIVENEIRTISHELKNELLSSNSDYIGILNALLEKQSEISKFEFKLKSDDLINWDAIDNYVKINIYRIIQESLQNINKHAKATLVEVNFKLDKEMLTLTIKDNGVGFDILKIKEGIGLKNMISRTDKLSGTFNVNSAPNQETIIKISIPI